MLLSSLIALQSPAAACSSIGQCKRSLADGDADIKGADDEQKEYGLTLPLA